MRYIQGATGRDFNRRKNREGAVWSGRYRPTLIHNGPHLSRCLFYIALNMVRAGEVEHPRDWRHCGYHEIMGTRHRKRVIDLERLMQCIGVASRIDEFRSWYLSTLEEQLESGYLRIGSEIT